MRHDNGGALKSATLAFAEAFEIDRLAVALDQHDGARDLARRNLAVDEILQRRHLVQSQLRCPVADRTTGFRRVMDLTSARRRPQRARRRCHGVMLISIGTLLGVAPSIRSARTYGTA
jgi:hypothetical protein